MNKCFISKNIPTIAPVLFKVKLIFGFEKTSELFNNRFASQSTFVKHPRTLLSLEYKTDERYNYFRINGNKILSIIKTLNTTSA